MEFTFPEPGTDAERRMLGGVRAHGWWVIEVPSDEEGPGVAFTVGLMANYGHPAIMMFGLGLDAMHELLNAIEDDVKSGRQIQPGERSSDDLDGFDCTFIEVLQERYSAFLKAAMWFYQGARFRVLQCVWPDRSGLFPWDTEFSEGLRPFHPVLNLPDLGGNATESL